MKNPQIARGAKTLAVSAGLALALAVGGAPNAAHAAQTTVETGKTGTTKVTVQADTSNLRFEVPTVIPFTAAPGGKLTGPTAGAAYIKNNSVYAIHVTNMKVEAANGWTIVTDATQTKTDNSIDFQVGPTGALKDAAAATGNGADVSKEAKFSMGYGGSANDKVALDTAGDVSRVAKDIHGGNQVATITWTLEAGVADGTA